MTTRLARRRRWVKRVRRSSRHPVRGLPGRLRRSERRPSEQLVAELEQIAALAATLDVRSPAEDFDVGLTTDDMLR